MNIKSFITSSTDANKISLTIKSLLAVAVLFGVDATIIDEASAPLTEGIIAIGTLLSAFSALWGLSRKVSLGRWNA